MLTLATVMNRLHLEDVNHQIRALGRLQPTHSLHGLLVCCTGLPWSVFTSIIAEETLR